MRDDTDGPDGPDGPDEPDQPDAAEASGRLEEALAARRTKLDRLRERGVEPFALGFEPSTSLSDIRTRFDVLEPGTETGERVSVAGRLMLLRRHGKLAFATIRDRAADLQLFLADDTLDTESRALVEDLDLGDLVGAHGEVVTTRRGEA